MTLKYTTSGGPKFCTGGKATGQRNWPLTSIWHHG